MAATLPHTRQECEMTTATWVILIIAIIAIACAVVIGFRLRSKKLKSRFGPEYDRLVHERGSTMTAERELEHREKRVNNFQIRTLSSDECDQFARDWRQTQERFVDDPRAALSDADNLVHRVMKSRGYPIGGEFDQRAADLSVDHPRVVEHYRAGHEIAVRDAQKAASTEDLRIAMQHYRALFEDLLGRHVGEVAGVKR
jgi:hypothetical protein